LAKENKELENKLNELEELAKKLQLGVYIFTNMVILQLKIIKEKKLSFLNQIMLQLCLQTIKYHLYYIIKKIS